MTHRHQERHVHARPLQKALADVLNPRRKKKLCHLRPTSGLFSELVT